MEQLNEIKKTHPNIIVNYLIATSYCYVQQGHLDEDESIELLRKLAVGFDLTEQQLINLSSEEITAKWVKGVGCWKLTEAVRLGLLEEETAKN